MTTCPVSHCESFRSNLSRKNDVGTYFATLLKPDEAEHYATLAWSR
jgi:hypothetical protein